MSQSLPTLGIIGAGKLGIVLAQLARKAGYTVYIAGSGEASKITLTVSVLVPGAIAATSKEVAEKADVIILAIPLGKYMNLPKESLRHKLVIDAMNYWWEVDGQRPEFTNPNQSTSELVQQFLDNKHVVKAFNHIGYHHLHDDTRPKASQDRKAVAIAGNNGADVDAVAEIVDNLGFDPVAIGSLQQGIKLQPGSPLFGAHIPKDRFMEVFSGL